MNMAGSFHSRQARDWGNSDSQVRLISRHFQSRRIARLPTSLWLKNFGSRCHTSN
jgi:hypothetical protein